MDEDVLGRLERGGQLRVVGLGEPVVDDLVDGGVLVIAAVVARARVRRDRAAVEEDPRVVGRGVVVRPPAPVVHVGPLGDRSIGRQVGVHLAELDFLEGQVQPDLLELGLENRSGFLAEARVVLVRQGRAGHDAGRREERLRLLDVGRVLEHVGVVGREQIGEDAVRALERALHHRVQEVVVGEEVVHRLAGLGRRERAVLAEDDVGHV